MNACISYQADLGCCPNWADYDQGVKDRAEALAWSTLRLLTGGLLGNCPVTFRPCVTAPCSSCSGSWMHPHIRDGRWVNHCGDTGCSCPQLSEIVLPGRVAQVLSITLDGFPFDQWRLDINRIVRLDGGAWPACQDMSMNISAPGTLFVEYLPGVEPDASGLWAAGVLACEFAKACTGGKCRLPASVTSITRQGVSMDFDNSMFSNGLTGIREVDAYVLSLNPHKFKVPPRVWSPDISHGRETAAVTPYGL